MSVPQTARPAAFSHHQCDRLLATVQKDAPSKAPLLSRVFAGMASPREAIKAKCLECVCFCEVEVRKCTSPGCPLWEYRPYQIK